MLGNFAFADPNGSDIPEPLPLNFGLNHSNSQREWNCESCNEIYDPDYYGAECCDDAYILSLDTPAYPDGITCAELESQFNWNCSGCECLGDGEGYESVFGCTDEDGCNYASGAFIDDGSCIFPDNYPDNIIDCDGNCSVVTDCDGVCNGSAYYDVCSVCDDDNTNGGVYEACACENTTGLNEYGCCDDVVADECGICGGEGIPEGACDCNGNDLDECGICGGDNSSC